MTEYKHWCGNCQIKTYVQRHYGQVLSWQDCPYVCEYAMAMRCSTETKVKWAVTGMAENKQFGISEQLSDAISRQGAINAIKDALLSWSNMPGWRDNKIVGALDKLPSAQQDCDGCKWSDAIGYGECHHCKRAFEDMYEKGEQP